VVSQAVWFDLAVNTELLVSISGKTSLLMALLGEMHFKALSVDSFFNLPRENGIAYAAQEAWIQNATIKVGRTHFSRIYDAHGRIGEHSVWCRVRRTTIH
jgi:hypothetical protein